MQTVNSKLNFTGIYKIPYTVENMEGIYEKVIPTYTSLKNNHITGFIGDNPFVESFECMKKLIAYRENASTDWLEINAKNHGKILPDTNTDFLYIISGKKDHTEFLKYIDTRMKAYQQSLINRFKQYINSIKYSYNLDKNTPHQIIGLDLATKIYEKERIKYEKFIKNKKIISVSSADELLEKMLSE